MCFSNTNQVILNLLENFSFKEKTKAGLCKKFFNFFWLGLSKTAFEV